ncbi:U4/U6-U5 snRNP complex subunit LSM8 [Polyrhizophydium stewartii]|uniref:LSM2-LSM8 complex subunit LSM8 n=1 Tax=Polyrhizophydium stewartii TaxID=2732419 RepID=A0ABR4MWY6_9FUNG
MSCSSRASSRPQHVQVITSDGRVLLGTLKGLDQTTNLVLAGAKEREFSPLGSKDIALGLYIVRGDTIAVVGEIDPQLDAQIEWETTGAEPLVSIARQFQ